MGNFTLVFLSFLAVSVVIQIWLSRRHLTYINAHRDKVPDAFADKISLDAHQKAADYTTTNTRIGIFELGISTLFLLVWTLGGGLDLLDQFWRDMAFSPIMTGIAVLLSAMLIMSLLEIPMSVYHTFVIEERFGFNKTTPKLFVVDMIKNTILTLAIGTPLIWVFLWLMENAGSLWWFYAWAVWMGFALLMMWAYPAFIAPLFNKFEALEDESLATRIQNLLERCGFKSKGIFVMDGSKRSAHGNAYFTGLGANKRIVFFDTLIKSLSPDEVEAVLAHELGHFKRKHIQKRIGVTFVTSLIGLWLLGWVMQQEWFYHGLGVQASSNYIALMLFMLVSPVFTFFMHPIMSFFSRKHEFEADDFAAMQTNANDLIQALVKLYEENANTLTPDPIYSAFHDSHPPAPVRVAHLATKIA
ncbi:MAG: M48 family metallopeptidase [Gammaproteobacteria bacterium]|nr:M48 family metallopeptidase [Gammaproteobacteria bacterium]